LNDASLRGTNASEASFEAARSADGVILAGTNSGIFRWDGTNWQPDGKIVELICHAEVRRQLPAPHPDNAEATVVGDDLSWSERINVFG